MPDSVRQVAQVTRLDMPLGSTAHVYWPDSTLKYLREDPVFPERSSVWRFQPYGSPEGAFVCFFHACPESLFDCVWALILIVVLNDAAYVPCVYVYVVCAVQTAVCQGVEVCILHKSLGEKVSVQWCFPVGTSLGCPARGSLLIWGSSVLSIARPSWCGLQPISFLQGPNYGCFPLHRSGERFGPSEEQDSRSSHPDLEPKGPEGLALHVKSPCEKLTEPVWKTATRDQSVPYFWPAPSILG